MRILRSYSQLDHSAGGESEEAHTVEANKTTRPAARLLFLCAVLLLAVVGACFQNMRTSCMSVSVMMMMRGSWGWCRAQTTQLSRTSLMMRFRSTFAIHAR
jgi:hypothetical protein